MSGKNNFATLKQYATKVYKFTQGKSLALLDPAKAANADAVNAVQLTEAEFEGAKGGICAALAADWLREKLASESALFTGASTGPGVHTGQNLDTVVRNVPKFLAYKENPLASEVLAQHGLAQTRKAIDNPILNQRVMVEDKGRNRDGSTYSRKVPMSVPKFAESMANACTAQFLKKRRGVYIGFSVVSKVPNKRGGGHAVAAYRSSGNTLYFFDCNCGVYNVTAPDGFFAAYAGCYDALGYTLALNAVRNDGFTYVDR